MIAAGAFTLVTLVLFIGAAIIVRWTGSLMDHGDGQGGVPPLPRRTRPLSLGGLVVPLFRDPARDCEFCAPRYDRAADCGCPVPCEDPGCGALAWAAVANTEEWER